MFDFPSHFISHREEARGDPAEAGWQTIHESGRLAREAGETMADCPRPPLSIAAAVWLAGYTGSSILLDVGTA